jgi:hypothetical protein
MSIHSDSELVHRLLEGVRLERSAYDAQPSEVPISAGSLPDAEDATQKSAVQYGAVLRKAEEMLEALAGSINPPSNFNRELARAVVLAPTRKPMADSKATIASDLTEDQQEACRRSLGLDVHYIWGPAGTGKTVTLGALAAHLFAEHKRVLVVAHTHQAVDGVLLALCKRIVQGPRAMLPEGSVIKLGSIARDDLRNSFGAAVSFESVTDIARAKMDARLQELSTELLAVEKAIWQRSHMRTLLDHERSLIQERERLLEALTVHSKGISRLFKPAPSDRDEVQLTGLKADLALVEASLDEVKRSLAGAKPESEAEGYLSELLDRQKELSGGVALLEGFVRDITAHVITRARVIGATSAKAVLWLSKLGQFDAVIIDEASMMPMVMSYLVSGMAKERVVVAGDFMQLPPISRHQSESARALFAQSAFESSKVAETLRSGRELPHVSVLTSHFRSHPEIMALLNERFYQQRLVSAYSEARVEQFASSISGLLDKRVAIVDTSNLSPEGLYRNGSKLNPVHALVVGTLVQRLCNSGDGRASAAISPSQVGIISPYRAHVEAIQDILRERELFGVVCGTVHRFQGDERAVMIFDLAESAPHRVGPFLSGGVSDDITTRLLNVALSRAREQLILVADLSHLRQKLGDESLIKSVLNDLADRGHIIQAENILGEGAISPARCAL